MILEVLGSAGAEFPGYNPPAFLIDGRMLLDAGTIGSRLNESEQWGIKHILITHSHLDHIKGIPFLADNIIIKNKKHSVTLYGIEETLASLRQNLLNDKIWPDFTKISAAIDPVLKMKNISAGRYFKLDGYSVKAYRVNHTVAAVGYVLKDRNDHVLLYTGDTGPTDEIWMINEEIDAVIAEVSFPNRLEALALKTGHLTAKLLVHELQKMKNPPGRILITHPKPQYIEEITGEIQKKGKGKFEMLKDGRTYEI